MVLIAGLGNPGASYLFTRHNAGFMVIDRLSMRAGIDSEEGGRRGSNFLYGRGTVGGEEVVLMKPLTFMNRSGGAVAPLLSDLGLDAASLIVVCDDCDLPFGKLRVRKSGGAGGQKGIGSIIEQLGSKDFARVKMGVGRPGGDGSDGDYDEDLSEYVLSPFSKEQRRDLGEFVERGAAAVEAIISDGVEKAMNLYN